MENEAKYEIVMYKFLIIVLIGIFIAMGMGYVAGNKIGFSKGVDTISVEKPEYCTVEKMGSEVIIKCNEIEATTAADLCKLTSPGLEEKIKIVLIN
jgi:hypothetical protein